MNVSFSEKLGYNFEKNVQPPYLTIPGNSDIKRDFGYNKFCFFGIEDFCFGLQFNVVRKKSVLEFGISNDNIICQTKISTLTSDEGSNSIFYLGNYNVISSRKIYSLSFKYNFKIANQDIKLSHDGLKTRVLFFVGIDVVSPIIDHFEKSLFSISYVTDVTKDTVIVVPDERYFRRIGPRLTFGVTVKLISKKNKPIVNFRTYWGTDSFIILGQRGISYYMNGKVYAYENATMSIAGWYFVLSRDICFSKKKR